MTRRRIRPDSNQESVVRAEFQRRSCMYENVEHTLAEWPLHEFRLYKAPRRKKYETYIENFEYWRRPQLVQKLTRVTEIWHRSTQQLNIVYQHGLGNVYQTN